MKSPYEILGVKENATEDEIKTAYREQVKKYHPDRYGDNPLQELAEEKMREINEAYDYLTKNNATRGNEYSQSRSYSNNSYRNSNTYGGDTNQSYQNIRNHINMNNLRAAEDELNRITDKGAEWFYLRGTISLKKGWYSQGYEDLQRAVSMDPSNLEYRETLNNIMNSNRAYATNYNNRRNNNSNDMCSLCTCLCCTDQCCECMGGDCISCC